MELIGCTTDKQRMIVSVDFAEVQALLNSCVAESARLDRMGHRRNDAEMIDQAAFILSTGNALDEAWVSGWHQ